VYVFYQKLIKQRGARETGGKTTGREKQNIHSKFGGGVYYYYYYCYYFIRIFVAFFTLSIAFHLMYKVLDVVLKKGRTGKHLEPSYTTPLFDSMHEISRK
jgi:hypothetical protein